MTSPVLMGSAMSPASLLKSFSEGSFPVSFKGKEVFDYLTEQTLQNDWEKLSVSQLMGHVAGLLKGTPYVGHTLELSPDKEICAINFEGLDCVTFFEDVLDFSRMILLGGRSPEAMLKQIEFTRYRGGKMTDYTSRLHYTTDWIYDNVKKGVVTSLTESLPGAEIFTQKVGFMTEHPEAYLQLKAHPELIPIIRKYENKINDRRSYYLPMDRVADAEHLLRTGDIIGVSTTEPGIDIAHTGIIYKDAHGVAHFMDASSGADSMKVTLEGPLHTSILWSHRNTGIVVARPLEPIKA